MSVPSYFPSPGTYPSFRVEQLPYYVGLVQLPLRGLHVLTHQVRYTGVHRVPVKRTGILGYTGVPVTVKGTGILGYRDTCKGVRYTGVQGYL